MHKEMKPKVVVTFTEGWEERFVEAIYKLYLDVLNDENEKEFGKKMLEHTRAKQSK